MVEIKYRKRKKIVKIRKSIKSKENTKYIILGHIVAQKSSFSSIIVGFRTTI